MIAIALSKEVLTEEVDFSKRILMKWLTRFDQGIPEVEIPANEGTLDFFIMEMCNELALVSDKLATVARLMSETQR